jgi:hypothetical protein
MTHRKRPLQLRPEPVERREGQVSQNAKANKHSEDQPQQKRPALYWSQW